MSLSVMSWKVYSAAVVGVEAFEAEVEVHPEWGNTDNIEVAGHRSAQTKVYILSRFN